MEGRVLGDFVVKERLGAGGGGEVFRAEQVSLAREAVIKIFYRSKNEESTSTERFLREARLASKLDHPFASHVYGFGSEPDGLMWMAMELVRGVTLETMIHEQGPMPLLRFVPFFERLCEVLQAAHDQGIVHRDIKPANIMVISRSGRLLPKLLDLGIARRGGERDGDSAEAEGGLHIEDERVPLPVDAGTTWSSATSTSTTLASRLVESETLNLTQQGAVIGTPRYMAPEQWVDAAHAGAPADLYSLALVAYEALTGQYPYVAKSLRQLARLHGKEPLPRLPASLPEALNDVLAKGSAKLPQDRYASALEFSAALSTASGTVSDEAPLIQLDEHLRENLLARAPQPLAESITLLEGARSARQQVEAALMVRRVAARYLGVLALAARARVGPSHDAPAVVALLRRLLTTGLNDGEWLTLASELCRPFVPRRAIHPLPDLVDFFFGDTDRRLGAGATALAAFEAVGLPVVDAGESEWHAAATALLPVLADALKALSFVCDFTLVVTKPPPERWMGTRRLRRVAQAVAGADSAAVGAPFLVDVTGLPVLALYPLAQVFTPGAGLPDELFFFEGAGRHGAKMAAWPGPFERHSEEALEWFAARVFDVRDGANGPSPEAKPPYKGLSTFTADDVDNYFGREREAESFANRLKLTSFLAVVGPSGSGKSSFVLAGVLPLLERGWRPVVTRPGSNPFQALAARLGAAGLAVNECTEAQIVASLAEGESLLLVVDQFEELVTLCSDVAVRESFARLLTALADSTSGRVRIVVTLRDDFLIRVQQLPALRERLSSALQLLGTPARADLLRVVTAPAKRVGYDFDDPALPGKMVDEVAEYPGALALLSFTASQLWELRDRQMHQMRAKTYEVLGGVGGALANHAENTLNQMSAGEAKLVREAFRHLVTSQSTRAVLSKKDLADLLGRTAEAHSVIEHLVRARLLVTSEDEGDDRIEVIHEALIVAWPRLVGWRHEDAETARLRDALRASTKQWADRGKPAGLLWRKEALVEYRTWRSRFGGRLTSLEEEFTSASLREEARARTLQRSAAVGAFVALVVGLVVVFRAYQRADASAVEAKANAAQATQRLAELRIEQARLAALDDKPFQTVLYAEQARALGGEGSVLDYLEQRARAKLRGTQAQRQLGAEGSVLQLSSSERTLAAVSTSGTLRLVALDTLEPQLVVRGHGANQTFAFVPLTESGLFCWGREVHLVSVAQGARRVATFPPDLRRCAVGPHGKTVAV